MQSTAVFGMSVKDEPLRGEGDGMFGSDALHNSKSRRTSSFRPPQEDSKLSLAGGAVSGKKLKELELKEKRAKHNEGESRRRQRMNDQFQELAGAVSTKMKSKPAILHDAIKKVGEMNQLIASLRRQLRSLQNHYPAPFNFFLNLQTVLANKKSYVTCLVHQHLLPPPSWAHRSILLLILATFVWLSLILIHLVCIIQDFSRVFYSVNLPRAITSLAGKVVACNDYFAQLLGIPKAELLGENGPSHFSFIHRFFMLVAFA